MSDPPFRRTSSSELTAVLPRPVLSTIPGPTIEQLADVERARRDAQDAIGTLVGCEWCCGAGMVTPEKAAYWRTRYPELEPEEPVPPSRPEAP